MKVWLNKCMCVWVNGGMGGCVGKWVAMWLSRWASGEVVVWLEKCGQLHERISGGGR